MTEQTQSGQPIRWIIAFAGLMGAAGITAAAAAAHWADERLLGAVSAICLANAPALIGLGIAGSRLRLGALVAILLILGTALFSGDVTLRAFYGEGLFPKAAPIGGSTVIIAWLLLAVDALLPRRD